MERFEFTYPASQSLPSHAQAGVVGSGDLEALYEPNAGEALIVRIATSVDGSQSLWQRFFDHLTGVRELPAGQLEIHDFGATPGVVRLRIEQVFEEAADVR